MKILKQQFKMMALLLLSLGASNLQAQSSALQSEVLEKAFGEVNTILNSPQSDLYSSKAPSKDCANLLGKYLFLANYIMSNLDYLIRQFEKTSSNQSSFIQSVKMLYEKNDQLNASDRQKKLLRLLYTKVRNKGYFLSQKNKDKFDDLAYQQSELEKKLQSEVNKMPRIVLHEITDTQDLQALDAWPQFKNSQKVYLQDYRIIMNYAPRSLRKKVYLAFNKNKQILKNIKLFQNLTKIRYKKARLLAYNSYSDMATSKNTLSTFDHANDFTTNLLNNIFPKVQKVEQQVKQYAFEKDGLTELQPWDFHFYKTKFFEFTLNYNEHNISNELNPYLRAESVLQGLFQHAKMLYGLNFVEDPASNEASKLLSTKSLDNEDETATTLDEMVVNAVKNGLAKASRTGALRQETKKVKKYRVFNEQGQELTPVEISFSSSHDQAIVIYSLFGGKVHKQGDDYDVKNYEDGAKKILWEHSFYKDVQKTEDVYLTLSGVKSMFHEFGHVLHYLYMKIPYGFIDMGSDMNFKEVPSSFMENYMYEEKSLRLYARHHKTHQPLSDELIFKIKQQTNPDIRMLDLLFDLMFHQTDLNLHNKTAGKGWGFEHNFLENMLLQMEQKWPSLEMAASQQLVIWTILMKASSSDYAGNTYSYTWAQMVASDIFESFKTRGLLYNADQVDKFRQHVLSHQSFNNVKALTNDLVSDKTNARTWLQQTMGH